MGLNLLNNKSFEDFIFELKKRLNNPLPGQTAHLKMASKLRYKEMKLEYDLSSAIPSAVLIILYPENNNINTVFILRPKYDGVHSGQVSFPGGRQEKSDRSLIETALRESQEEVNIDSSCVELIGNLSELYIPPSNFLVLPVIGYLRNKPDLIADNNEVAEIITSDISFLFDKTHIKEKIINVRGYEIQAPYYDVKGHVIWGATAMILSELKETIESIT